MHVRCVALIAWLLAASNCLAVLPAKSHSTLLLTFKGDEVALSATQRLALHEHLASMSARGECRVEILLVADGSRPLLVKDAGGPPLTARERYLVEQLARESQHRVYFMSRREAEGAVRPEQVRLEFVTKLGSKGCAVRSE
jgi:hypothetical protein